MWCNSLWTLGNLYICWYICLCIDVEDADSHQLLILLLSLPFILLAPLSSHFPPSMSLRSITTLLLWLLQSVFSKYYIGVVQPRRYFRNEPLKMIMTRKRPGGGARVHLQAFREMLFHISNRAAAKRTFSDITMGWPHCQSEVYMRMPLAEVHSWNWSLPLSLPLSLFLSPFLPFSLSLPLFLPPLRQTSNWLVWVSPLPFHSLPHLPPLSLFVEE